MKSYFYYFSLVFCLPLTVCAICDWLQVDPILRNYLSGVVVGYIICRMHCHNRIEACNKLISEIKEIAPRIK